MDLTWAGSVHGETGSKTFEHLKDPQRVQHLVHRLCRGHHASTGKAPREPVRDESTNRLPDRGSAHPESFGEWDLDKSFPGTNQALEDLVPQDCVGNVGLRAYGP